MSRSELNSVVTSLLEIHSLQRDFQGTSELDQVLKKLMQATVDDSCVWVSKI